MHLQWFLLLADMNANPVPDRICRKNKGLGSALSEGVSLFQEPCPESDFAHGNHQVFSLLRRCICRYRDLQPDCYLKRIYAEKHFFYSSAPLFAILFP